MANGGDLSYVISCDPGFSMLVIPVHSDNILEGLELIG